jgi:hypothetical protein
MSQVPLSQASPALLLGPPLIVEKVSKMLGNIMEALTTIQVLAASGDEDDELYKECTTATENLEKAVVSTLRTFKARGVALAGGLPFQSLCSIWTRLGLLVSGEEITWVWDADSTIWKERGEPLVKIITIWMELLQRALEFVAKDELTERPVPRFGAGFQPMKNTVMDPHNREGAPASLAAMGANRADLTKYTGLDAAAKAVLSNTPFSGEVQHFSGSEYMFAPNTTLLEDKFEQGVLSYDITTGNLTPKQNRKLNAHETRVTMRDTHIRLVSQARGDTNNVFVKEWAAWELFVMQILDEKNGHDFEEVSKFVRRCEHNRRTGHISYLDVASLAHELYLPQIASMAKRFKVT